MKKELSAKPFTDDNLTEASLILINLTTIQNDSTMISELFTHFDNLKRLMPRKIVETLYTAGQLLLLDRKNT